MGLWNWPWSYPSVPTRTSNNTSGVSQGHCCKCREYGMVLLNGHTFYCWDHYCAEMERQRRAVVVKGD